MPSLLRGLIGSLSALAVAGQAMHPPIALALTGGPTQPEVQTFQPIDATGHVDPFTGDFTYNIPLLDVGGYPLNLTYRSGITMDQEATFVGLGWNLNVGAINRVVRGLPDDFRGERLTKEQSIRDNITFGGSIGAGLEVFGFEGPVSPQVTVGWSQNTYQGLGLNLGGDVTVSGGGSKPALTVGLGVSANSGATFNVSTSLASMNKTQNYEAVNGASLGLSFSSRRGLEALQLTGYASRNYPNGGSTGVRSSNSLSFASTSFTPSIDVPQENQAHTIRGRLGGELWGLTGNVSGSGFYSRQSLAERNRRTSVPAFGYLYAHDAGQTDRVIHDFNRTSDVSAVVPTIPNLPLTQQTYDLYQVSAHGLQANFRPHRSDFGMVFDHEVQLGGIGGHSGSFEIAGGQAVKAGADIVVNFVNSRAGKWPVARDIEDAFSFRSADQTDPTFEPFYFQQIGELSAFSDENRLEALGADAPVRLNLDGQELTSQLSGALGDATLEMQRWTTHTTRQERAPRALHFSFLTAKEAATLGLDRKIRDYYPNHLGTILDDFGTRAHYREHRRCSSKRCAVAGEGEPAEDEGFREPHHISEITVLRGDGYRYVYGLPVYNTVKEEVSFSVCGRATPAFRCIRSSDLVTYRTSSNADDSLANERGDRNYFSRVSTPPYAYAYLLTAVLSADYVDRTGDGPSRDDYGRYTRFNYQRAHENYRWRTPSTGDADTRPTGTGQAALTEANLSDPGDDIGSYVFGEKEVWYPHSIETRNFVAEFHMSQRSDALGSDGRAGGFSTGDRLKKLDEIRLYNLIDRRDNGEDAKPLRRVLFKYDYSLAAGVPNFSALEAEELAASPSGNPPGAGKLTLRSVSILNENSERGALSPYRFDYSESNPDYDRKGNDRWASYQPNATPSNVRAPYTRQNDRRAADQNASAWHLTTIDLPSGGRLRVEYEADDYAYVQDRRAQFMTAIVETGKSGTSTVGPEEDCLYERTSPPIIAWRQNCEYLFFDLLEPLRESDTAELSEYFAGISELYVNTMVRVRHYEGGKRDEFVQTFLPIASPDDGSSSFGLDVNPDHTFFDEEGDLRHRRAWVKIGKAEDAPLGDDRSEHPLSLAAWQKLRRDVPKIAFNQPDEADGELEPPSAEELAQRLASLHNLIDQFASLDSTFLITGQAESLVLGESFIRLNHPTRRKIGGGSRVKRLFLDDRWGTMVPASPDLLDHSYVQEFDYTLDPDEAGSAQGISSGVAAYEPLVGGDENPLVQPIWYEHDGDRLFVAGPIGEAFYPGPSVGYRRVSVRNVPPEVDAGDVGGTGRTVHEFYTAYDFPVRVRQTYLVGPDGRDRDKFPANPFELATALLPYSESRDRLAMSQGYVVELNDMHGKPKSMLVYPEGEGSRALMGYRHKYRSDPEDPRRLVSSAPTIRRSHDGRLVRDERSLVGLTFDLVADAREQSHAVKGPGAQLNTDVFTYGPFPAFVPTVWGELTQETTRFRSFVLTKVIHRSGILDETVAFDSGAQLATRNRVWDYETGRVIVSETETEHGFPRYSTNLPAYFEHPRMAGAWRNHGFEFAIERIDEGRFRTEPPALERVVPGDKLALRDRDEEGSTLAWVLNVNVAENLIALIDSQGNAIGDDWTNARILRSGFRNLTGETAGFVQTLQAPHTNVDQALAFDEVLDAAATEYSESWQTYRSVDTCRVQDLFVGVGTTINPFRETIRGNWRAKQSLRYLDGRIADLRPRRAGIYQRSFEPLWDILIPAGDGLRWQWTESARLMDPFGQVLEVEDAQGRRASERTGFGYSVVTAAAGNAGLSDVLAEGFEQYLHRGGARISDDCLAKALPWRWRTGSGNIARQLNRSHAHTGRASLTVDRSTASLEIPLEGVRCDRMEPNGDRSERTYTLEQCDLIPPFSPSSMSGGVSGEYVLSVWVSTATGPGADPDPVPDETPHVNVTISDPDGDQSVRMSQQGLSVDGWRRIEGRFTISDTASDLNIELISDRGVAFFDDLRVHPAEATLRSFVYSDFDLRFEAVLDENNYATSFSYSSDGALARINRETVDGFLTVQEINHGSPKVNPR